MTGEVKSFENEIEGIDLDRHQGFTKFTIIGENMTETVRKFPRQLNYNNILCKKQIFYTFCFLKSGILQSNAFHP